MLFRSRLPEEPILAGSCAAQPTSPCVATLADIEAGGAQVSLKTASTIIIAAFSGWNDAAESASDAVDFLLDSWDGHVATELPSDDFYDYSYSRPEAVLGAHNAREIDWPGTTGFHAHGHPLGQREVYIVQGVEPNFRWKSFCEQILAAIAAEAAAGGLVITELKPGKGDPALPGMLVAVHYTGWLQDTSRPDGKGQQFEIGRAHV